MTNITDLISQHPNARPCQDHRNLEEGGVFVAIMGTSFDGHMVLGDVVSKKPVALVVQDESKVPDHFKGTVIKVSNTRDAMDKLSHAYWKQPSKKLFCVGITGTNGKTTTCHMIEFGLNYFGFPTGVVGTIDHHLQTPTKTYRWDTQLTSPASFDFYSRLNDFNERGAKALAVEVSSHALDQRRMTACEFDVGVFTNLTRDHLDYHGSMEEYFRSKELLFTEALKNSPKKNKYAVVNFDDSYGRKLQIPDGIQLISYGSKGADISYELVSQSFEGQTLLVRYRNQEYPARIKLSGQFNVLNYLATLGVMVAKGVDIKEAIEAYQNFSGVRGRLQRVKPLSAENPNVFVDYAHTPDALESVLKTLFEIKNSKKIITVFGCGGDRDKGKRPLMGAVACKYSDHVIITSDNPRTESPQKIIQDIEEGCAEMGNYETQSDRRLAIKMAIELARSGDAVLIAGKGHENYQIIGTTKYDFDDVKVAQEFFK